MEDGESATKEPLTHEKPEKVTNLVPRKDLPTNLEGNDVLLGLQYGLEDLAQTVAHYEVELANRGFTPGMEAYEQGNKNSVYKKLERITLPSETIQKYVIFLKEIQNDDFDHNQALSGPWNLVGRSLHEIIDTSLVYNYGMSAYFVDHPDYGNGKDPAPLNQIAQRYEQLCGIIRRIKGVKVGTVPRFLDHVDVEGNIGSGFYSSILEGNTGRLRVEYDTQYLLRENPYVRDKIIHGLKNLESSKIPNAMLEVVHYPYSITKPDGTVVSINGTITCANPASLPI